MSFNLNVIKSNKPIISSSFKKAKSVSDNFFDGGERIFTDVKFKDVNNTNTVFKNNGFIKRFYGIGEGNELSDFQRNLRYGTTIGVGAGLVSASVYNRYKSGGTVTTNSKGEKDIVGIPIL